MPSGRILLKRVSESKKLSELKTDGARLLYSWLIPHVDINGCFSGDASVVNGKIFTRLNKTIAEVEAYLKDLEKLNLIVRYSAKNDIFLQIPDFKEKQPSLRADRERMPHIPTSEQVRSNSSHKLSKVKLSKDADDKHPPELPQKEYKLKKENDCQLVYHYKVCKGFKIDDRSFDAGGAFGRWRKVAKQLLEIIPDVNIAKQCITAIGNKRKYQGLNEWSLDNVVKWAPEWLLEYKSNQEQQKNADIAKMKQKEEQNRLDEEARKEIDFRRKTEDIYKNMTADKKREIDNEISKYLKER